jgi:hypothetical protein
VASSFVAATTAAPRGASRWKKPNEATRVV